MTSVNEQNPLDDRKEEILREIVEAYIKRGEPVGSKAVADGTDLGVSSATIRNEMAILEREGYISHPHTSAGRVPTDKAYRYYVDVLAPKVATDPSRRREIEGSLAGAVSALDELLNRASQLLSELTDYTSLAAHPSMGDSKLERIEVVRLGSSRLLLVCVGEDGWHEERLVELESELTDDAVRSALQLANTVVEGAMPVQAARAIDEIAAPVDVEPVLRALATGLTTVARAPGRIHTGGTSKLIVWEPVGTAQRVLEMFDAGGVEPLLPAPDPNAVTVRIGNELAFEELRDLSLIAAGYRFGRRSGTLGVLGPTRMDYPNVISTVAEVASTLSRLLRQLGP
ncbi:MAG TPA: heat-inducible transcriptional repressor HrcA [Actinomycetota bacterium]|jgi:heat-inducible transcriptional repressor|nr:heat-inducible transcriptional repressor HrcA [Actinomycetota bacterium]